MPMEKTFDAAEAEARLYAMWEGMGAFRAGANAHRREPHLPHLRRGNPAGLLPITRAPPGNPAKSYPARAGLTVPHFGGACSPRLPVHSR